MRGVFAAATISYVAVAVIALWVWRTSGVRAGGPVSAGVVGAD
jgi:hypothetical protein